MRDLKRKILMNKQKGVNQNGITPKINCIAYADIAFYSTYQTLPLIVCKFFTGFLIISGTYPYHSASQSYFFNQDVFHDNLLGFIKK